MIQKRQWRGSDLTFGLLPIHYSQHDPLFGTFAMDLASRRELLRRCEAVSPIIKIQKIILTKINATEKDFYGVLLW